MTGFAILRRDGLLQKTYDIALSTVTIDVYRTLDDAQFVNRVALNGAGFRVVRVNIEIVEES